MGGNEYGCGSAFGMLGAYLQAEGGTFEFALVGILSAAALAAIMSSADSVILGVSNTLCVEYRNMINPDAEQSSVVRLGYGVSLVMAIVGAFLAMNINGSTFINWLGLQMASSSSSCRLSFWVCTRTHHRGLSERECSLGWPLSAPCSMCSSSETQLLQVCFSITSQ